MNVTTEKNFNEIIKCLKVKNELTVKEICYATKINIKTLYRNLKLMQLKKIIVITYTRKLHIKRFPIKLISLNK